MMPTVPPPALILRLHKNGMVEPYWTWRQAKIARLGLPLACAMLMVETGGGHNEYGHDSDKKGHCPGWGWGTVTKANYLVFRRIRDLEGRSNGVGGCQLTSPGLQDAADKLGGCWLPRCNFAIGFHYLADHIRKAQSELGADAGLVAGVAAYNGTGAAAQAYARRVLDLAEHFKAAKCGTVVGVY